ncbi:17655_t:CDS:2 [Cetraspora pellucida]|uniref:17655_t:CDS:1 n=1 Tax=Cetraspora pellucida TaxID=1433469 RepID=A0A9N9JXF6_9GLOM|nr:17655_t:CDS:2 [Cetraspora pellucida]
MKVKTTYTKKTCCKNCHERNKKSNAHLEITRLTQELEEQ